MCVSDMDKVQLYVHMIIVIHKQLFSSFPDKFRILTRGYWLEQTICTLNINIIACFNWEFILSSGKTV